jgi:alpha-glucosidase
LERKKSVLYEDAKDGYDYNKGLFSLRTFNLTGKDKELIIQQHREGTFETHYSKFKIN